MESVLGESQASEGLDLLELTEYAWHDCYGEITPPDDVIVNILICAAAQKDPIVVGNDPGRATQLIEEAERLAQSVTTT